MGCNGDMVPPVSKCLHDGPVHGKVALGFRREDTQYPGSITCIHQQPPHQQPKQLLCLHFR